MSDVNDLRKLLDNDRMVILFRNGMGSYTAAATQKRSAIPRLPKGCVITDDFTPADALYRLTEKATTGRIVGVDEVKDE